MPYPKVLTKRKKQRVLTLLKHGATHQEAADEVGASRMAIYRERVRDAEFQRQHDEVLLQRRKLMGVSAEDMAQALVDSGNWNAIRFALTNRLPEFWKEKPELSTEEEGLIERFRKFQAAAPDDSDDGEHVNGGVEGGVEGLDSADGEGPA